MIVAHYFVPANSQTKFGLQNQTILEVMPIWPEKTCDCHGVFTPYALAAWMKPGRNILESSSAGLEPMQHIFSKPSDK
jgi:hypothetical protein